MRISRIVVQNYKALKNVDLQIRDDICCVVGENNTGKSALFRALQICVDVSLPGYLRNLVPEDIHSSVDIGVPSQVLIGVEFSDFQGKVQEEALVSTWKIAEDKARLFYRFRPRRSVVEKLGSGLIEAGDLTIDDYAWEIKGGGDPAIDLTAIAWDDDGIGESVRFSDLQSYLVVNMPALRDVEAELRAFRTSPLVRLIEAFDIPEGEQEELVQILQDANNEISESDTVSEIAEKLDDRFKEVAGPAFEMDADLGLSAATFQSILRNLRILLSDHALAEFEPGRNGLGMNNILYISILMEYFQRRLNKENSSGQLILIEEPEAHLHPQLQASLILALKDFKSQIIFSTHSTQISSRLPFSSLVSLTRKADHSIGAATLIENPELGDAEVADLERYLDATKSNLLLARRVMLVEGAAELFLVPALVKSALGIDLERHGISIVAIHGVHFKAYTKLFRDGALEKKCAVVADADLKPSDASDEFESDIDIARLTELEGPFVRTFAGATTFERELVSIESLPMFIEAVAALEAPRVAQRLRTGLEYLNGDEGTEDERLEKLNEMKDIVLQQANRFGKARFAQVAARYSSKCSSLPDYINNAVNWLLE